MSCEKGGTHYACDCQIKLIADLKAESKRHLDNYVSAGRLNDKIREQKRKLEKKISLYESLGEKDDMTIQCMTQIIEQLEGQLKEVKGE